MLFFTSIVTLAVLLRPSFAIQGRPWHRSQIVTEGEMTEAEYEAYMNFVYRVRNEDALGQKYCDTHNEHSFFNIFKISARCPEPILQHPSHGRDGSKMACNLKALKAPCVIYSFGSEGNFMFENDVAQFGCEIHTFDCFYKPTPGAVPRHVNFYPYCVDGHDHGNYYTIPSLMKMLNHTRVDYLKIDVEGAEHESLPKLKDIPYDQRPAQIAVEIHAWNDKPNSSRSLPKLKRALDLLISLHEMGYRLISREDNLPATCCSEFVFALPDRLPGGGASFPYQQ
jgi:hypothetical protein